MSRTSNIYSRVVRNVRKYIPDYTGANKLEIYEAMQKAQNEVIALCGLEREITLTMVLNQADYSLVKSSKKIIGVISEIILPTTWEASRDTDHGEPLSGQGLTFIPNKKWGELLAANVSASNPIYYTIFGNELKLNPAPSTAGEEIILWCTLTGSDTEIAAAVDPEIEDMFDSAIEYGASNELVDHLTDKYEVLFKQEIQNKGYIPHLKQNRDKVDPVGDW